MSANRLHSDTAQICCFFLYDLYTDSVNGEDENILHVVTVDECEEMKCVDLKTVF